MIDRDVGAGIVEDRCLVDDLGTLCVRKVDGKGTLVWGSLWSVVSLWRGKRQGGTRIDTNVTGVGRLFRPLCLWLFTSRLLHYAG